MKVINMVMMRIIMMMIKFCNLSTHISLVDCPIQLAILIGPKSDHCLALSVTQGSPIFKSAVPIWALPK